MTGKRLWTQQQNDTLVYLKEIKKIPKWTQIAEIMEVKYGIIGRNGKQCRQRYHNHLNSHIIKTTWSRDQLLNLVQLHKKHGNSWAAIARQLPGRTDNCVKNHFFSILRKGLKAFNKTLKKKLKRCHTFKADIIFELASKVNQQTPRQTISPAIINLILDFACNQEIAEKLPKESLLEAHRAISALIKYCKEPVNLLNMKENLLSKKQTTIAASMIADEKNGLAPVDTLAAMDNEIISLIGDQQFESKQASDIFPEMRQYGEDDYNIEPNQFVGEQVSRRFWFSEQHFYF